MSKERATAKGLGFGTILFLIFLVLKLCDKITWSWWWVFAPLWLPLSIVVVIFGIAVVITVLTKK